MCLIGISFASTISLPFNDPTIRMINNTLNEGFIHCPSISEVKFAKGVRHRFFSASDLNSFRELNIEIALNRTFKFLRIMKLSFILLLLISACQPALMNSVEVTEPVDNTVPVAPRPSEAVNVPPYRETIDPPVNLPIPLPKEIEVLIEPPKKIADDLLSVTYSLLPGPNFIPVSLFTSLNSHDLLSMADCNATELHSQVLDTDKLTYSPSKRLIHTKSTDPIAITAHEVYMLYCKDTGSVTIQGILAKVKPLQFDGNYIVVHSPIVGKDLISRITCDPSVMVKDMWIVQDGTIRKAAGDKILVESNDGSRFSVSPISTVFIRCTRDGEYRIP